MKVSKTETKINKKVAHFNCHQAHDRSLMSFECFQRDLQDSLKQSKNLPQQFINGILLPNSIPSDLKQNYIVMIL